MDDVHHAVGNGDGGGGNDKDKDKDKDNDKDNDEGGEVDVGEVVLASGRPVID